MDYCNFLVWNVRGLNSPARRTAVRSLIGMHAVSVVCLQETKLSSVDSAVVSEICGATFSEFAFSPSDGASGGLLVAWTDAVAVTSVQCSTNFISLKCSNKITSDSWHLINVYGPQPPKEKISFLNDLQLLCMNSPDPLMLVGDFNLIAATADKSTSNINRGLINAFRNFMNRLELKDMYLHGRRYTWSNEQLHTILVRLDRVLYNQPWNELFPNALLQGLSSADSDHCPLLLTSNALFRPQRRFMFENMWVRLEGFNDVVPAAWDKATKSSDPYTNLHNKLSFTAKQLKSWASSLLSDIQLRTRIVHELILQLDIARDSRMLTPEEHTFRGKLKMMSLGFAALDRCMLCQRS